MRKRSNVVDFLFSFFSVKHEYIDKIFVLCSQSKHLDHDVKMYRVNWCATRRYQIRLPSDRTVLLTYCNTVDLASMFKPLGTK